MISKSAFDATAWIDAQLRKTNDTEVFSGLVKIADTIITLREKLELATASLAEAEKEKDKWEDACVGSQDALDRAEAELDAAEQAITDTSKAAEFLRVLIDPKTPDATKLFFRRIYFSEIGEIDPGN